MTILKIKSLEEFSLFERNEGLSVIHYMADWAAQCEQMNDVMEELSKQENLKEIKFANIPAEDIPEASLKYDIKAIPTIIILLNNKSVERVDGANAAELTTKLHKQAEKYSLTKVASINVPNLTEEDKMAKLKKLINSAKCMVFMKGNPENPQCGFSRTLVDLLKKYNAEFGYFDILSDEEVRQDLKIYSNWPTYPQLYIDGDLIGGLDILKEMDTSNELGPILPQKISLDNRLKNLINRSHLMIFMKGNPSAPRCGFSKQLMGILNEIGLAFDTFDILEDEDVRQGLKSFSNWPTYPQIYVKGELIGGLDIIKEMKEDCSLVSTLKGE